MYASWNFTRPSCYLCLPIDSEKNVFIRHSGKQGQVIEQLAFSEENNMMKPVVLILLVAVVAGISAQPPPPKCCVADQFEIGVDQLIGTVESGKGVPIGQTIKMAFDFTNKQVGEIATTYEGATVYNYRVVLDYNKGVEFIIDEKASTCQRVPFNSTMKMEQCIPGDAKLLDTFFLGNNQITANSFAYQYTEGPMTGQVTVAATKTDCILLSSSFVGETAGTGLLVGAEYKNFVKGIKDPTVYFNVPSYCPQTVSNKPKAYLNHMRLLFL